MDLLFVNVLRVHSEVPALLARLAPLIFGLESRHSYRSSSPQKLITGSGNRAAICSTKAAPPEVSETTPKRPAARAEPGQMRNHPAQRADVAFNSLD